MVAEFYLLGNARRTQAFIVAAWCLQPEAGWKFLRYCDIWDFTTIGPIDILRTDFDPYTKKIWAIDTMMPGIGRRKNPADS